MSLVHIVELVVVGTALLWFGFFVLRINEERTETLLRTGRRAEGRVDALMPMMRVARIIAVPSRYHVSFEAGDEPRKEIANLFAPPRWQAGQNVTVAYDPKVPGRLCLADPIGSRSTHAVSGLWQSAGRIFVALGTVASVAAALGFLARLL